MLFFFNDTATTEIYTLSLHDALPIYSPAATTCRMLARTTRRTCSSSTARLWPIDSSNSSTPYLPARSEEHTSALQSPCNIVCRLLLEKKNSLSTVQRPLHREYTSPQP